MIPVPTTGSAELMRAAATFNTKVAAGITRLSAITDEQVQIATTPKDEVFRRDKVTLYRYRPLAKRKVATPVLIVYSLIGRYTMTDLQEDRSLIRNLLKQGLDVWVIDWGNASRADRYLPSTTMCWAIWTIVSPRCAARPKPKRSICWVSARAVRSRWPTQHSSRRR